VVWKGELLAASAYVSAVPKKEKKRALQATPLQSSITASHRTKKMEGLFQQIMDLGEEKEADVPSPSAFSSGFASAISGAMSSAFAGNVMRRTAAESPPTSPKAATANAASSRDASTAAPTAESNAMAVNVKGGAQRSPSAANSEDPAMVQLRHSLQLQKKRYDDLLADSHRLRSEYDAYQLRTNHVVRQYKQQALQDKHMLEELRVAGASGSLDEAYVTGMKRQIGELQRQLNESLAAAEKAYQRQREAEEARAATERAKREELEALASQIANFYSVSLTPAAETAAAAANDEQDTATDYAASPQSAPEEETVVAAAESANPDEVRAAVEGEKVVEANGDEVVEGGEKDDRKTTAADVPQIARQLLQAQAQLALRHAEMTELRAQLQLHEATYQQQLEEKAHDLETLRKDIEQGKQRESALKASHAAALKKVEAENAEKEAALRRDLETAREQAQKASAEQSSQRLAQELLETQEREQEERMQAKELELQSVRASLQSLQAAVEATHAELREMEMTLHDAQAENRQLQAKADQASTELRRCEQQLASREDEMLDAEKERQKLRAMLRQEEEETLRVRQQLKQLQRIEAERGVGTRVLGAAGGTTPAQPTGDGGAACDGSVGAADGEGDATRLSSVVATQRQTIQKLHTRIEGLENELTTREVALRRQQAQAQETSTARIELIKTKEETNARVEQYKDKIRRLESDLAAARQSGAAAAAAAVSALSTEDGQAAGEAGLLTSSMERRQFLMEAKRSAELYRISRVRQMRIAFFAVLLLVVGMTLYTGFSLAPPPAEVQ
jgi:chromosome segregation ATPase